MLSREFTTKEKILLLVCALLALGVLYYQFVFKGVRQQISNYATDALEAEIETEQMRAAKIKEMESVIEANQGREIGDLMVYNNLAAEINMISSITNKKAEKVSVTWDTPVLKGTTVRRGFSITFQTNRYAYMKEILDAFNTCQYRCIIHDLSVADNSPTTRSVVARVGAFLEELRGREENILISTHAIAMKGILEYLTPASNGAYWSKFIGNCAVYTAQNRNGTFTVPTELL